MRFTKLIWELVCLYLLLLRAGCSQCPSNTGDFDAACRVKQEDKKSREIDLIRAELESLIGAAEKAQANLQAAIDRAAAITNQDIVAATSLSHNKLAQSLDLHLTDSDKPKLAGCFHT